MIMAAHGYPGQEPYSQLEIVPPEDHTYSHLEIVPTQPVAKDITQPSTAEAYPVFKEHQDLCQQKLMLVEAFGGDGRSG